jgi:ELWxxDGT repeat protein
MGFRLSSRRVGCQIAHRTLLRVELLEARLLPSLSPHLLKDINPGLSGSSPSQAVDVNGTAFFAADNGVSGVELWRSNGTAAGTLLVKDINPGGTSSYPSDLTNINGTLFFSAAKLGLGYELWKSNGTAGGTVLVKDIDPGSASSYPGKLTNVNGTLFFTANNGAGGVELWRSNGTATGTVLVKNIDHGSYPNYLTNVNGVLFFAAKDGTHGVELWKSSGSFANTQLVKDINASTTAYPSSSDPQFLTNLNGELLFAANDGTEGDELWKSNGTSAGTIEVQDIMPGRGGSYPNNLTAIGHTLFFGASGSLWRTDGTAAGTLRVKNIAPVKSTAVNSTLFFTSDDGTHGTELWKSNGSAVGTTLVRDITPGRYNVSPPKYLTNVNGTLFFQADDTLHGAELWVSNGSPAGTFLVRDIMPGGGSSSPNNFANVNGTLFFDANDSAHGTEPWVLVRPSLGVLFDSFGSQIFAGISMATGGSINAIMETQTAPAVRQRPSLELDGHNPAEHRIAESSARSDLVGILGHWRHRNGSDAPWDDWDLPAVGR